MLRVVEGGIEVGRLYDRQRSGRGWDFIDKNPKIGENGGVLRKKKINKWGWR